MQDEVLIIRFPDGDTEIYAGPFMPSVGDRLSRRSADWIVARVELNLLGRTAVTVMPAAVERDETWPQPYEFIRAERR